MKEVQVPKQRIDTGIRGDASTGDTLFDGGVKINSVIDEIYNIYGDWRQSQNPNTGAGLQKLFAMGYWQKYPIQYYTGGPVEMGTMHDINTSDNPLTVILPNGKKGEQVFFRDSSNSWGTNVLSVTPQAGESIDGITDPVDFNQPNSILEFTCINDTIGSVTWTYKIIPIRGDFSVPVNTTREVTNVASQNINLFPANTYNAVKLLIYASDIPGVNKSTAELVIMPDVATNDVLSNEYAVLTKGDKPYTLSFNIANGIVRANVSTQSTRIVFSIKSIETVKVITT